MHSDKLNVNNQQSLDNFFSDASYKKQACIDISDLVCNSGFSFTAISNSAVLQKYFTQNYKLSIKSPNTIRS